MLDVWPLLPIAVWSSGHEMWGGDSIFAALEYNDRICELGLSDFSSSQMEKVWEALRQPFPVLTRLHLRLGDEAAPVDPDSFLGGSAPCLQLLKLTQAGSHSISGITETTFISHSPCSS
jgi:hypothetical protein